MTPSVNEVRSTLARIESNIPKKHGNADVKQQIAFQAKTVENNCLQGDVVCPALVIAAMQGRLSDLACTASQDLVYGFLQAGDIVPQICDARGTQIG